MNIEVALPPAELSYALAFAVVGPTLEVVMTGQRPEGQTGAEHPCAQACRAIAERIRQLGCDGLMVQVNLAGQATSTDAYRTAKSLEALGFDRRLRIACVFPEPQAYRVNLLGIRLACDDGWDIAGFTCADLARTWLRAPRGGRALG